MITIPTWLFVLVMFGPLVIVACYLEWLLANWIWDHAGDWLYRKIMGTEKDHD